MSFCDTKRASTSQIYACSWLFSAFYDWGMTVEVHFEGGRFAGEVEGGDGTKYQGLC